MQTTGLRAYPSSLYRKQWGFTKLNKGLNPDLPAGLEPMIDLGN